MFNVLSRQDIGQLTLYYPQNNFLVPNIFRAQHQSDLASGDGCSQYEGKKEAVGH